MKKFYVTAIREIEGRKRKIHRTVPAKNERTAIRNCSYKDIVLKCEPYCGQDLESATKACINTRRW